MSENVMRPVRPIGVTVVVALIWIGAAFDVIAGILAFALLGVPEATELVGGPAALTTLAIVSILLGVAAFVIGFGVLRGNPVSRLAASVIELFSIAVSIWHLVIDSTTIASEVLSALVAVAIIVLLWTGQAGRWFKQLAPDEPDTV